MAASRSQETIRRSTESITATSLPAAAPSNQATAARAAHAAGSAMSKAPHRRVIRPSWRASSATSPAKRRHHDPRTSTARYRAGIARSVVKRAMTCWSTSRSCGRRLSPWLAWAAGRTRASSSSSSGGRIRSHPRAARSMIVALSPAAVSVASFVSMLTTAGVSERNRSTSSAGAGRGGATRCSLHRNTRKPLTTHSAVSSSHTRSNAGARTSKGHHRLGHGIIVASRGRSEGIVRRCGVRSVPRCRAAPTRCAEGTGSRCRRHRARP